MSPPEKLILKRSVPVEIFGKRTNLFPLPPGEYTPTVWDVGDGVGFNEWWLVTVDCHQYALGLPAQEWRALAGQGFLTIQKQEDLCVGKDA